ncbi:MAG: pyruvate kinase [Thermodesulfobacteriota bacterium]
MNFTKIICTVGPSSDSEEKIKDLAMEGMNIARLNFSHGDHAYHKKTLEKINRISSKLKTPVSVLQDLCGPKMRVGEINEPGLLLKPGDELILSSKDGLKGENNTVSVSYKNLALDVKLDEIILLADGVLSVKVVEKNSKEIRCKVINGGLLTSKKGINLPSGTLNAPSLTDKDRIDLEFGIKNNVDFVALSFVRKKEDILEVKKIIADHGKNIPVIAKIEKHEALENIDEIIEVSDAVMVARGDLGVEIRLSMVPATQKMIIKKGNKLGKPVIIATQMLGSMTGSPRPTRAEAADVSNAVLDGADALMLSEETASGNYPYDAVRYMKEIIHEAEKIYPFEKIRPESAVGGVPQSVARAACTLADELSCRAVVAPTRSGFTASQISKFRPKCPVIAFTPDLKVIKRLNLYWGVFTFEFPEVGDTDSMINNAAEKCIETGIVKKGDRIVITAGHPLWISRTTNMVQVREV